MTSARGYLYRCFAPDGTLLYVGISGKPMQRFTNHRSGSPWWSEVARTQIEQCDSMQLARTFEAHAIHHERPRYNKPSRRDQGMSRSQWREFEASLARHQAALARKRAAA